MLSCPFLLPCLDPPYFKVNRTFPFFAFLLLALWLPATLHCDLEAANLGVWGEGEHHGDSCQAVCINDACHIIEGTSYVKSDIGLRMQPTPLVCTISFLNLLADLVWVEHTPVYLASASVPIQALNRTWAFVRRAALPVRAPCFLA